MSPTLFISIAAREKSYTYPFNPAFFMLSTGKSFEILPKHNGCGFVSESYALNWYIFTPLSYKILLLPL